MDRVDRRGCVYSATNKGVIDIGDEGVIVIDMSSGSSFW